jgi:hypothetical protein
MTEAQRVMMERAVAVLKVEDEIRKARRENDAELRVLCREYDKEFGVWGSAPHHLRLVAENYGLLDKAV